MSQETKVVLVTGASGFLGFHLCEHYLLAGYKVAGLDNFATGLKSNVSELLARFPQSFTFYEADVCKDWPSIESCGERLDYLFHFASPASPVHYQRLALETLAANSIGLEKSLEFATQHKARLVFASTSEVYGDPTVSPQPERYWGNVNSFGPRSCYDEAKRYGEALIHAYNKRHATRHGLVRIFNTYGPRMNPEDGRVIINFIRQALRGENLTIYGDGSQTRSFCFVSDLINAITSYAENPELDFPVNIGNETEFTIIELAELTRELFNKNVKIEYLAALADDPRQRRPDLTLAKRLLKNWRPTITLRVGLERTAEGLRASLNSVPER